MYSIGYIVTKNIEKCLVFQFQLHFLGHFFHIFDEFEKQKNATH